MDQSLWEAEGSSKRKAHRRNPPEVRRWRRGWLADPEATERGGCRSKSWIWGKSQGLSATSATGKKFPADGARLLFYMVFSIFVVAQRNKI